MVQPGVVLQAEETPGNTVAPTESDALYFPIKQEAATEVAASEIAASEIAASEAAVLSRLFGT